MTEQEKDFKIVLFEGLGLASMCWSETPKGVFDDALAVKKGNEIYDAHVSDRDKFAMEFVMWLQINQWDYYLSDMIWIKNQDYMNGKETFELLDLFKAHQENKTI